MHFFEHQDQARGRTTLLVTLFFIAVLCLGAVSGIVTHLLLAADVEPGDPLSKNHFSIVATATIATFGIILLGSVYRIAQLRGGGVTVAETLGGTLVTAQSSDLLERRIVNVVEEMAIASGLPVPPVYVMQNEAGINAFAAGWSPDDAVIGVTRGALEGLTRDQLQGVVAHEFSHIFNRDCALNMRLMGILHGIVVISIIGRILMRFGASGGSGSRRGNGAVQFLVAGVAIWIFGSLGLLAARTIQAAVSRQREYLADASAVQFTRNPEGIGGALATIGSQTSSLGSVRGAETSHMLFGEPSNMGFLGFLASHPPLFDRIRRVLPRWNGDFSVLATPPGAVQRALQSGREPAPKRGGEFMRDVLSGGIFTSADPTQAVMGTLILDEVAQKPNAPLVEKARHLLASIPPRLKDAAEDPYLARALILAWVLDKNESERSAQLALISVDPPLCQEAERLYATLPQLDKVAILPLFDVAVGTLSVLSEPQKASFHSLLTSVAAQLSATSYRGYCLASLALRHLDPTPEHTKKSSVLIKDAIETVLGILAVEGHDNESAAQAAFKDGVEQLGKRGQSLRMPSPQGLNVVALDGSLSTLLRLPTTTRAELLTAAELIASHDGTLRPEEAELLRVMAVWLGVAAAPAFATA